jgi:NAD(P)H-flavin reductase
VCGGPEMVQTTVAALVDKGADPERIQHDPLTA